MRIRVRGGQSDRTVTALPNAVLACIAKGALGRGASQPGGRGPDRQVN